MLKREFKLRWKHLQVSMVLAATVVLAACTTKPTAQASPSAQLAKPAAASNVDRSAEDEWLILPDAHGTIGPATSRAELVRRYGAANVVDTDVDIGEGETEPGTVLFPDTQTQSVDVLWKDPGKKTRIASLTVRGNKSRWHTAFGITLGTSLKQLEQINGRPFTLAGFDWDYGGTVVSWKGGSLTHRLGEGQVSMRAIVRLNYSNEKKDTPGVGEVGSDQPYRSSLQIMQKLNPEVYQIVWSFD